MAKRKDQEPGTASFAGFARILGERSPSYVTQLKGEGRLVLTDDGKRVRVQESLERIKATADPSKAGVVARHEVAREGGCPITITSVSGTPFVVTERKERSDRIIDVVIDAMARDIAQRPPAQADGDDGADVEVDAGGGYQDARAMRERYLAKAAKRDYEVSIGKLLEADQVTAAVAAAAATLRTRFEAMPDVLGPQLAAAQDEAAARAILSEAIEHTLEEASRQFAAIGRGSVDG